MEQNENDLIVGRQAVKEALEYGLVKKVFLIRDQKGAIIADISDAAQQKGIPLVALSRDAFERLVGDGTAHQGAAAQAPPYRYFNLEELLRAAKKDRSPFLILLDHIHDQIGRAHV